MNILEKIFGRFKKPVEKNTVPAPNNVSGDFYVQCNSCIQCGAPEAEAPDLMIMTYTGCYFRKQPETEEETERAINALAVSCISAVRYRGTDEEILKKIIDLGLKAQCDILL